ncbi:MAG: hypothetical protein ACLPSH_06680 [Vulcanimicrobiaceae bacterium]
MRKNFRKRPGRRAHFTLGVSAPSASTIPTVTACNYAGLHHWIGDAARIGLVYQHFGQQPGTDQPIAGTAYVSGYSANGLELETLLSF